MTERKNDHPEARYRVTSLASFRLLSPHEVEVVTARDTIKLPLDKLQLLLAFAEPSSIGEVHELLIGDVSRESLTSIVHSLLARGLLEESTGGGTSEANNISERPLSHYLSERYQSDGALSAIGTLLRAGKCVVIDDAFQVDFAERMHDCLDRYTAWKPYDDYSREGLSYHHHNIYDRYLFPPELRDCQQVFSSALTKNMMERLTERDCQGETAFGASLYLPGDYSLPHSDDDGFRNVSFIWHLAKDWKSTWGGGLFWSPSQNRLHAQFNTLTMFNVTAQSVHFVEAVRPTARGRRYAINGWWQSVTEATARRAISASAEDIDLGNMQSIPGIRVL